MIVDLPLPAFRLHCGLPLPGLHVRAQVLGPGTEALSPWAVEVSPSPTPVRRTSDALRRLWAAPAPPRLDDTVPTVLIVHALTGDARVSGPGGWWSDLVGPGKVYDTDRKRIVCMNLLGSCYGTFGADDEGFPRWHDLAGAETSDAPPWRPAPLTPWDQARAQLALLDALGIEHVERAAGGSLGGMVALATQALAPERVHAVDAIATDAVATPWILGWNHVGRQATLRDPRDGLALARQLAHLSYRADPGLTIRHARRRTDDTPTAPYQLQNYLSHHGNKLVARFTAAAYVAMLDTMDHHDLGVPVPTVGDQAPDAEPAERHLHHLRAVGISTDQLFPADRMRALAQRVPGSTYATLDNPHGHDAFLLDPQGVVAALRVQGDP